ncbi:MAG: Glutamine amidotransferase, class I, partial [uncultured Gemmatimonadetes bacterium]
GAEHRTPADRPDDLARAHGVARAAGSEAELAVHRGGGGAGGRVHPADAGARPGVGGADRGGGARAGADGGRGRGPRALRPGAPPHRYLREPRARRHGTRRAGRGPAPRHPRARHLPGDAAPERGAGRHANPGYRVREAGWAAARAGGAGGQGVAPRHRGRRDGAGLHPGHAGALHQLLPPPGGGRAGERPARLRLGRRRRGGGDRGHRRRLDLRRPVAPGARRGRVPRGPARPQPAPLLGVRPGGPGVRGDQRL